MATFRSNWKILNVSSFVPEEIQRWMYFGEVPRCFKFEIVTGSDAKYMIYSDRGKYRKIPFPGNDWEMVVFSTQDPRFTPVDTGASRPRRCVVAVFPKDNPIVIGSRIRCEMLVAMGINPDKMETEDRGEFIAWLSRNKKTSIGYFINPVPYVENWNTLGQELLLDYYDFLTEKYFPNCTIVSNDKKPQIRPPNDPDISNGNHETNNCLTKFIGKIVKTTNSIFHKRKV